MVLTPSTQKHKASTEMALPSTKLPANGCKTIDNVLPWHILYGALPTTFAFLDGLCAIQIVFEFDGQRNGL